MTTAPHQLTPAFSEPHYHANLYTHYEHMQAHTPVFESSEGVVYLTRHADCLHLLTNKSFRRTAPSSGEPFDTLAASPLEAMIHDWVVFMDPPRHAVIRQAFAAPFQHDQMSLLQAWITSQAQALLDALPKDGPVNFLDDFAYLLPVRVIARLMGVPQSDTHLFNAWALQLTEALDTANSSSLQKGTVAAQELKAYFSELLRQPHQLPENSLLSRGSPDGSSLTLDEWFYGCIFLLWAGHETTKNLLSSGLLLMAQHPDQWHFLKQQPDVLPLAIEEMLRCDSPTQKVSRWTTVPTVFGNYRVPPNTLVTTLIGAANRDPLVFERAQHFDVQRGKNRHLAFGAGIHHCLGAPLARLEAKVAFALMLPRLKKLELLSHQWRPYSAFRSLGQLDVRLELTC